MADEYLRALSWEAATERLEAAGSVPVKEAELMKEALSSEDAGIEVSSRCFSMSAAFSVALQLTNAPLLDNSPTVDR